MTVKEHGTVENTCYRLLEIQAEAPGRHFSKDLILLPDKRFLAPEVFDTTSDPAEMEKRELQRMQSSLTAGRPPTRGHEGAPVSIVMFSDFQCPYCKTAAGTIQKLLESEDGQNARLVLRHLPLPIHEWSRGAAEASVCVLLQGSGAFWSLHDRLFEQQEQLSAAGLSSVIDDVLDVVSGANKDAYNRCMKDGVGKERVDEDVKLAMTVKVTGTPTLFLNGRRLEWSGGEEQLKTWIHQLAEEQQRGH
jgi:protein-disulfide isomerase